MPASEIDEQVSTLRDGGARYASGRDPLAQRLALRVVARLEAAGVYPDERGVAVIARSAPVSATEKQVWPSVDAGSALFELLSSPVALAAADDGVLDEDEQRVLLWDNPARSKGSARWSVPDLALLDELADVLTRVPGLGHVVLDEAQDLSPMQLRAVGRRAVRGSLTVLGDIAQGTTPWATQSSDVARSHLGKTDFEQVVLTRGFRVPASVLEYASRLLPHMAPGLSMPESVREHPGRLDIVLTRAVSELTVLHESP